ncbi:MAG: copper ion binding protein [Bacillota bacterium]|nr:copper ion binding protein [Bacillota bacterium]
MKKVITIEGMSCGHCVNHVKEALNEIEGVRNVEVNLEAKTAVFETYTEVEDSKVKAAIEDAGYEVVSIS